MSFLFYMLEYSSTVISEVLSVPQLLYVYLQPIVFLIKKTMENMDNYSYYLQSKVVDLCQKCIQDKGKTGESAF